MGDSKFPLHRITTASKTVSQRIEASHGSTIANVEQKTYIGDQYPQVYLQLGFAGTDPFTYPEKPSELHPGQRYEIIVSTDINPTIGCSPIRMRTDLTLRLTITHIDEEVCNVPPPEIHLEQSICTLRKAELDNFTHSFFIHIFEGAPSCFLQFSLHYVEKNRTGVSARMANSLQAEVVGEHTRLPLDLSHLIIELDNKRRPHNSLLFSVRRKAESLLITRWPTRNRRIPILLPSLPNIGIAQFIEEQILPSTIIARLHDFRRRSPHINKLARWLGQRIALAEKNSITLIIQDDSGLDVPWELMEIEDGVPLGTLIPVVRWIHIRTMHGGSIPIINKQHSRYQRVMTFLDEDELAHTEHEKAALAKFNSYSLQSLREVMDQLEGDLSEIGLLHLSCHGIFTYDRFTVGLKSLHNPSSRILVLDLERIPPKDGSLPLMFVNACHSARLLHDSVGPYGLPEVALGRVASGYIGTLGPVGDHYADEIAGMILDALADEMPIAHAMQKVRTRALKDYTDAKLAYSAGQLSRRELRDIEVRLLYSFIYVFYGHPESKVRLEKSSHIGNENV